MRKNDKKRADAIGVQIGTLIAEVNATKLAHLSYKTGAQTLWKTVREMTKPNNHNCKEDINAPSASDLNRYYAHISHDDQ